MEKLNHNVLAEGEVTGHSHRATGEDVSLWNGSEGVIVLDAPLGSTVVHEEHGPITLPPGRYVRRIVQEYDHFAEEARNVVD